MEREELDYKEKRSLSSSQSSESKITKIINIKIKDQLLIDYQFVYSIQFQ